MTREIHITPVLNGWVCQVGCQRVVFNNLDLMINNLRAYYLDPHSVEKSFVVAKVNDTLEGPCEPPQEEALRAVLNRDIENAKSMLRTATAAR